jgi:large subunit ribosomal protein L5
MADEKKNNPQKGEAKAGGAKPDKAGAAAKGKGEGRSKAVKSTVEIDDGSAPRGPRVEPRLHTRYKSEVAPKLAGAFGLKNPMQWPKLRAITLNVNMGRHLEGMKVPPVVKTTITETITKVTGQKPVMVRAKKSVSNFKVREGAETSFVVTLRRDRMWHFLDRFINLTCPRIKDFRGLKENAFDKQGNYSLGLQEQGVFPEINMADVTFTHGMNINLVFSRSKPEVSRFILAELGMPFRKPEEKK